MRDHPSHLRLCDDAEPGKTTCYRATLMAAGEGGENTFEFLAPPHLMDQPADDIFEAFVNYINRC